MCCMLGSSYMLVLLIVVFGWVVPVVLYDCCLDSIKVVLSVKLI